nr:MaoC/PaaZ C-terminal domain-containing protein [uncultured Leptotrichia sp.]
MNVFTYDEIKKGYSFQFNEKITEEMMTLFLELSGDTNPLHCDKNYALEKKMKDRVVYGMLSSSFYSKLVGVYIPGKYCLLQGIKIQFNNPLFIGDEITVNGKVVDKDDTFKILKIKANIKTFDKIISKAEIIVGVMK